MIDLLSERTISLAEAAALIPSSRRGRPTHTSRLVRWIVQGAEGPHGIVKLDAARLGRSWITSKEALQRFVEALTPTAPGTPTMRAATARRKEHEHAELALEKIGL